MFNQGFNNFGNNQNNQGGIFGGNKPPQQGGLFGANNNQQGGLFGGGNNNAGGFGNNQQGGFGQVANQNQGLFGGNAANNNNPFGNNQAPQQQAGMFGNNNTQQQGLFGNNQQQPQQNAGLFGNNQPANNTGLFGGQQQQPQQGLFGGAPQQNNTGLFGQNNNNNAGNGLFGGNNQQQQGNGLFGAPQNTGTGLFGATANTANNGFLGNQAQQANPFATNNTFGNNNNNTGLFGANNNNNNAGNSLFGNNNAQQQQPNNTGGLFNTFAPANNAQPANGFFGQTNNLTTPAPAANSIFGNNTFNNNANNNNNNKLGGTAWGVPTLGSTPSVANMGTQTIQPVKSKNSKLDAKHMVKCIAALDQFTGLSKEEIRMNFVQNGGQQPVINQQQTLQPQFGANQNGFKPLGNTFTAQTSLPSFGGIGTNNNIAPANNSLFGQAQPAQGAFAKPAFGAATGQGTSLFGQATQPSPPSLFGAPQPQQQTTSLFGQPATTPANTFGQTSLFGQPTAAQPATSLFGAQPAQQTTSLFGQTAPATTSLFGQPAQTTPSLFGAQQPQTNSLFGAQPAPSLFGQTPAAGQTPSLFNTTPSLFNTQPTPGVFGAAQPQPQPGFFSQPAPTAFGQLSAPLYQAPQGLDPSLQVLLPQLLLSLALNQSQTASTDPNNSIVDLISKLTTLVAANSTANNTATAVTSTPFDEFMNEAKKETALLQKKENDQHYSLFSDFQKEPNYYLQSSAFSGQSYKNREEPYQIQAVHKVPRREDSRTDRDYRQVPLKYKSSEDQSRKRFGVASSDLPRVGEFQIFPSLEKLKNRTSDQLRNVKNVKIWNEYGEIQFLQPISLYRLNLDDGVKISQDNIEITDSDLEDKSMRMTFRNFGKYTSLKGEEREKMLKRMRKWMQKYDMREILHNDVNGDLTVQVDN